MPLQLPDMWFSGYFLISKNTGQKSQYEIIKSISTRGSIIYQQQLL